MPEVEGTYHVVVNRVQRVQQTRRAPSTAAYYERLLRRVVRELIAWCPVLLREIVERAAGCESDEGDCSSRLQKALPQR